MSNRHSSVDHKQIALDNIILRGLVGSTVHGTQVATQDDRDEMGICLEPPEHLLGLKLIDGHPFEQYIFRSQPEGARSGPGDLDLTVYSLRKWMRLALNGNPTVLLLLFVPLDKLVTERPAGYLLRAVGPDRIISKQAGYRFHGYMVAQRERLLGQRGGMDCNRTELIEQYGFDTKFAGHYIRLGMQGIELMTTGSLTLPMYQEHSAIVRSIRTGEWTKENVLSFGRVLETRLEKVLQQTRLPEEPDRAWGDRFLKSTYLSHWRENGML